MYRRKAQSIKYIYQLQPDCLRGVMTVAREKHDYELAVVQDQSPTLTHCPVYNIINKNLNIIFALWPWNQKW